MPAVFEVFWFRQALFALLHAAALLLGFGPFNIWPLAFVATFALIRAADEQADFPLPKVFSAGGLFAFGLTTVTFGWIIGTIHRYTGSHWYWTLLLSLAYALLFQAKPLLYFLARRFLLKGDANWRTGLAVAALIATIDALAPELFPWCWGNALSDEPHFRSLAALGSVYLVSFAAAYGGWLISFAFRRPARRRLLAATAPFVVIFLVGVVFRYLPGQVKGEPIRVAAIQTNIGAAPEVKRGDASFATEAVNRLFRQSLEAFVIHGQLDLVLWGEASMPFHASLKRGNEAIYSPTFDGVLEYVSRVTGATVVYQDMTYDDGRLFSRLATRPLAGEVYLKRRLVPWGEYLPLENYFPSLRRLFADAGRFNPGNQMPELAVTSRGRHDEFFSRERLAADILLIDHPEKIAEKYPWGAPRRSLKIKPILCYEGLYPSDALTRDADLLVNLASDAWFGDGIEGWQHGGAASLRAVENGIPMARAAMSGVTYAVDAQGDFIGQPTGQGREQVFHAEIPLSRRGTPFSWGGMALFYGLMLVAVLPFIAFRIRENR